MNNAKHTQGPWTMQKPRGPQHAIRREWEIVAKHDCGKTIIVGEHTGIDSLREHNARLIAAAPELLAVMEEAEYQSRFRRPVKKATWLKMRAAIAKAKGE